jgi:hypothetical protein
VVAGRFSVWRKFRDERKPFDLGHSAASKTPPEIVSTAACKSSFA